MQSPFPSPPLPQPGEGGKGDSREAAWLVVKRHLEKKNRNFSFCEVETEMRKIKAVLCASRKINKQRRASCAINQSRASRAIKTALRYQSKPRFARN
jgi:hypothetical protein